MPNDPFQFRFVAINTWITNSDLFGKCEKGTHTHASLCRIFVGFKISTRKIIQCGQMINERMNDRLHYVIDPFAGYKRKVLSKPRVRARACERGSENENQIRQKYYSSLSRYACQSTGNFGLLFFIRTRKRNSSFMWSSLNFSLTLSQFHMPTPRQFI